jgi:hypothetical protein
MRGEPPEQSVRIGLGIEPQGLERLSESAVDGPELVAQRIGIGHRPIDLSEIVDAAADDGQGVGFHIAMLSHEQGEVKAFVL